MPPRPQRPPGRTPNRSDRPTGGTDDFSRLMRANTVDVAAAARGSSAAAGARSGRTRRRSPLPGKISLGLAVVCVALDASAFAVFMGGEMDFAAGMCFVVVFLTVIAAVLGFVAAVGGLGRWYGVIAVLVAFVGNPVVLLIGLAVFAPEMTAQLSSSGT